MVNLKNDSIENIVRKYKDKKIICFGAGSLAEQMVKEYSSIQIQNNIFMFFDNNPDKQGKKVVLGEVEIPVSSPEEMKQYKKDEVVLILTTYFYVDILCELDDNDMFHGVDCYIFPYSNHYFKPSPISFRLEKEMKIPKVIHYFWLGGGEIPQEQKEYMKTWRKFCPDYEIVEWNENNYDIKKIPYMEEAYGSKKWGFVPDYARLDIIHQYGGIYLDTDVEVLRNLDDLLYQQAFCGFESKYLVNFGSGFGSAPGNSLIKELMDDYNDRHFVKENGDLDLTVSCEIQTSLLKKKGLILNNSLQRVENITVYPSDVLSPLHIISRIEDITENSYSIHRFAGSWCPKEQIQSANAANEWSKKLKKRFS